MSRSQQSMPRRRRITALVAGLSLAALVVPPTQSVGAAPADDGDAPVETVADAPDDTAPADSDTESQGEQADDTTVAVDATTEADDTDPQTTVAPVTDTTIVEAPAETTAPVEQPTTTEAPADASVDVGVFDAPAVVDVGGSRGAPTRSETPVQVIPVPPPPPTLPPAWELPANSGNGRRVVYSKSRQRVWVVDGAGDVIKKHLVSGRQTPLDPRPGTYSVWSRSIRTFAIQNPTITWGYMVRFAKGAQGGNIGFHEIPFQYGRPVQSISQLGQPLSGGCVRQAQPDAIWMWNWAQIGTKVVVLP